VAQVKQYNPHIIELDVTSNSLTTLPDDLAELRYIRILRVKYNKLPCIPLVCFQLEELMNLEVAGNQITTLPDDIVKLQALRDLDISGNRITKLSGMP
jgi:Leucine-rich repeat (LRR) protein